MEYTATHLKRQLIHFMALRVDVFAKYCNDHILFEYNNPQLNKNFSYKDYLLYMHQDHSWGDACILNAASLLFEVSISVLFPKTLKHLNLRHTENDLSKIDVILLNSGGQHYSASGKGRRRSYWVVFVGNGSDRQANRSLSWTYNAQSCVRGNGSLLQVLRSDSKKMGRHCD